MKKRFVIFALLVIFLVSLHHANAITITYDAIQKDVLPGQDPTFIIIIDNNEDRSTSATLKSVDLNWLLDQENQKFIVNKNSKREVRVIYKPIGEVSPGSYGINLIVDTDTSRFEKVLPVTVVPFDEALKLLTEEEDI